MVVAPLVVALVGRPLLVVLVVVVALARLDVVAVALAAHPGPT